MPQPIGFPIGYVSSYTGLSTHVLRAWERRYNAVKPNRSAGGRRLYSQADIDRLSLLKRVVDSGHAISNVARLATTKLNELIERCEPFEISGQKNANVPPDMGVAAPDELVSVCLRAVTRLDTASLNQKLKEGAIAYGRQILIDRVIKPLMEQVGNRWSEGSLGIVHGQFAAAVVYAQLGNMLFEYYERSFQKPCMLIATPAGQFCYLGAMAVAVTAQDQGWEPIFLGFNLPAREVATASDALSPQLIALSITCRVNDVFMEGEIEKVSASINGRCPLVVGGRSSDAYRQCVETLGGAVCGSTEDLIRLLQ